MLAVTPTTVGRCPKDPHDKENQVNKQELMDAVADRAGVTEPSERKAVAKVVNAFLSVVQGGGDPLLRSSWYTDDELDAAQVVPTGLDDGATTCSSPGTCSARWGPLVRGGRLGVVPARRSSARAQPGGHGRWP
jgi:hypothetical protein